MRVVGLTGGIASGKSTAARVLSELGAKVVDADLVARQVVEPGQPAYHEIVTAFGREILLPEGGINRKALGALVFGDGAQRARLNAITHPRIAAATQQKLAQLTADGEKVAIYEAALLVENGLYQAFDGLIVVACSEAEQVERLQLRDGLSEAEALQRIRAQAPLSEKIAVAKWVIDSSGSLEELRRRVEAVWAEIQK